MDDNRLYVMNLQELQSLIKIIGKFTIGINMEIGIDKRKIQHLGKGQWSDRNSTDTLNNVVLQNMEEN